jgi:hypothetical protein
MSALPQKAIYTSSSQPFFPGYVLPHELQMPFTNTFDPVVFSAAVGCCHFKLHHPKPDNLFSGILKDA